MAVLGEALLIKLWDTLADKGLGGLLRPWQIGREARAHTEARRLDMLTLAAAEKEAQDIRSGRKTFAQASFVLSLPFNESVDAVRIDPSFGLEVGACPSIKYPLTSSVVDAVRREVNVARSIVKAEEALKDDSTVVSDVEIEDDWIFRWRDYAGDVSSEELQQLWGRILAGELKAPGKYSYRTLELMRGLTLQEAKHIEIVFSFVLANMVALPSVANNGVFGLKLRDFLALQEIGILQGVESNFSRTFSSLRSDQYKSVLLSGDRILVIDDPDPLKKFILTGYVLSNVGCELYSLGNFSHNEEFMRAIGEFIKTQGFQVRINNKFEGIDVGGETL